MTFGETLFNPASQDTSVSLFLPSHSFGVVSLLLHEESFYGMTPLTGVMIIIFIVLLHNSLSLLSLELAARLTSLKGQFSYHFLAQNLSDGFLYLKLRSCYFFRRAVTDFTTWRQLSCLVKTSQLSPTHNTDCLLALSATLFLIIMPSSPSESCFLDHKMDYSHHSWKATSFPINIPTSHLVSILLQTPILTLFVIMLCLFWLTHELLRAGTLPHSPSFWILGDGTFWRDEGKILQ